MLRVRGLDKRFGGVHATRNVSIDFPDRCLSAIIGPNGAGKTTFFNLLSGHVRADTGSVRFDDAELVGLSSLQVARRGVVRAFQVASLFPTLSVREALCAAVTAHRRGSWRLLGGFPARAMTDQADEAMELMGLSGRAGVLSRNLSHGDQKLLDIGLALAQQPRVLLLDEPTAGMGPDERWQMVERVHALWQARPMSVLFIEHDMDIVFRIAQSVHVLKYGAVLAEGTPDEVRRNPDVIDAYLGADHRLAEALDDA